MSEELGDDVIEQPYVLVHTMLSCSTKNIFGCAESVFLFLLAVFSALCGFIAIRNILKDRNNTLDLNGKIIIYIAYVQIIMLIVQFGFYDTQMIHFSQRVLFFVNSLNVCNVVIYIQDLTDAMKSNVDKAIKLSFGYVFCLWFFCGFLHKNTPQAPYNCFLIDWMLISGSNLILGCVLGYITMNIIQFIQNKINYTDPNQVDENGQTFSKEDCEDRKVQVTGLLLGVFIPKFIQYLWDYLAHTHAESLIECNEYYFANSFLTFILFFILKVICFFIGPYSIFFVFYWKNKSQINTLQENPTDFFYDRRSELLERISY